MEQNENTKPDVKATKEKNDLKTFLIALLTSIIVVALYHFGIGLYAIYNGTSDYCSIPVTRQYILVPVSSFPQEGPGMGMHPGMRGPHGNFCPGMRGPQGDRFSPENARRKGDRFSPENARRKGDRFSPENPRHKGTPAPEMKQGAPAPKELPPETEAK